MLTWFLALLTPVLLILTYPRFEISWLAAVALAPLLVAVTLESRPWRRFLLGWVAGIVYWFGVCYWIQEVLAVHGGMSQGTAWALFTLFAVTKALHMAVFALVAGILMRGWWAIPAVSSLWVALEVTHGPLGFAWLALGNAGIGMEIPMRLAPLTGVYGLSFAFAMMSVALALAALRRPRLEIAWLAAFIVVVFLPSLPAAHRGQESALLVQGNISETEAWTPQTFDRTQNDQAMLTLRGLPGSRQNSPRIVVWGEVPAPFYYDEDPRFREYANGLARTMNAYLLMGVVARTPEGAPLNSVVLISPTGSLVSRYDKVNLVPFGEFVPWPFGALTRKISTEAGDFAAGTRVVVSPVGDRKIGTFICYESVFPNFVRKFAAGGAEVLFNLSNDGWFGRSAARWQHLEIVRMRAAENRRWILRATNDGITATIDSAGRLRATLPSYIQAGSLTAFNFTAEQTFYTRWGDWFPAVCAAIALLCLVAELVPAKVIRAGLRARRHP